MPQPFNTIFWMRAGLGSFTGLLAGLLGFTSDNPAAGLGALLAISMYLFSVFLFRGMYQASIEAKDRRKLITTGIGTFIMLFLFTWIFYNTIFFAQDVGGLGRNLEELLPN